MNLFRLGGGNGNGNGPRLLSGSVKIPAGQDTPSVLRIQFPPGTPERVTLELTRGSFSPADTQRSQDFALDDGVAEVAVFAPWRPTTGILHGHGLRLRLGFVPVKFMHIVLWEWLPIALGALLATLLLRTFAFASFFIPSSSMEDTIMTGDLVLSWNVPFKLLGQDPRRGQIIVFDHPDEDPDMWIKRVAGVPGDVVECHGGQLVVNGEPLDEPYIKAPSYHDFGPVYVPDGYYFVLGDNRQNSFDSRYWGLLPRENIVGRAAFVFWPWSRARVVYNE
ncbi:MAG TPA: signal peptidase I [Firmicutes bacterium]|nr:signal peptidase I [Bacillota bacterium]